MTKRLITHFLFAVIGAFGLLLGLNLMGFGPALVSHESVRVILPPQRQQAQPARQMKHHAAPKPQMVAPAVERPIQAPAVSETIINIYPPAPTPAPTPSVPTQSAPTPSVQIPAPAPTPPPPSPVVQPQVQPAPPIPQAVMTPAPPARTVNVLSGNILQFRVEILSRNGSWNGSARYGYGSSYYGWTPGYVARVCEERPTGTVCFDRWIANPLPNY